MFPKLVLMTCVLAFCAVVFSAYARLTDAGLGCDNWPACYQENALKQRQPPAAEVTRDHTAWQWKLQNLVGALLGILAIAICGHSWQKRGELRVSPLLPTLLVVLMAFLAIFGILAFSYLPRPVIVLIHLAGGIAMLMMLAWIAFRLWILETLSIRVAGGLRLFSWAGIVLLAIEIMLGGWVSANFASLACTDFPLCQGSLLPAMDFSYGLEPDGLPLSRERLTAIHWIHRVGALIVLVYLSWLSFRVKAMPSLKHIGNAVLLLVIFQCLIGVSNIALRLPIMGAVMHNAVAMLLVFVLLFLSFKLGNKDRARLF